MFSTDPFHVFDSFQVGQFVHGMPTALATVGPVTWTRNNILYYVHYALTSFLYTYLIVLRWLSNVVE